MRVFVTGATGFIGTAIVADLIAAGHQVLGLTRSVTGARSLTEAGAQPHQGTLEDPASLQSGASQADGVIHCAFDHDFSHFLENCEKDRRAIEAMAATLAGSARPLVITSGVGMGSPDTGGPATEDIFNLAHPNPRIASELAGAAALQAGTNISVVRLPQVHDPLKQGLITPLIERTRERGVSAYPGEGQNRWSAVHVTDAARLYRLALERNEPGARYNAVAEEGIHVRTIAEIIGRGLNLPVISVSGEQATTHFGWLAMFASLDMPASSERTQEKLAWRPTGPGLVADLEQMRWVDG